MIQSIYTSVSNADVVPCGKKGLVIQSAPIPLLRNNYLGEYRTELEKAKVRKNLGIADDVTLQWGNIFGFIEQQTDLIDYIKSTLEYTHSISDDITNIKEALDYAIYYVSNFKSDTESILLLKKDVIQINDDILELGLKIDLVDLGLLDDINKLEQVLKDDISQNISELNLYIYNVELDLRNTINNNSESLGILYGSIDNINERIEQLNQNLINIDVDANILAWVQNKVIGSNSIELTETNLEVKISPEEKNAVQLNNGLYVEDHSEEIAKILPLLDSVQGMGTYLTNLSDDAKAPTTIGGVSEGTKVSELKGKTFIEIIDTLLFPTSVRLLEYPLLYYNEIPYLVEVGLSLIIPELLYYRGDAGETLELTEQIFDPSNNIIESTGTYSSIGTYTYKASLSYAAGEYLENNKGEITNIRIEEGIVSTEIYTTATYPWYTSSNAGESPETKQELVAFGTSDKITFPLQKQPLIWLPGENSTLLSFKADTGLGYLPVDMDGWIESIKLYNGITYRVWTKNNTYPAIITHEIQFKLAL